MTNRLQVSSFSNKIAGISTAAIFDMFYNCHEYHFDENPKNKRKGYYTRICLPYEGSIMEQNNVIIEAFKIIKGEEFQIACGY